MDARLSALWRLARQAGAVGSLAVSLWLAAPVMAAPFSITARIPITDESPAVAEKLREAARLAGCADPRVAMRWLGGTEGLEIEVRCSE